MDTEVFRRKYQGNAMIRQFRVKNYKAIQEVDIPLSPIHVLIGQNDSGKTSLLEAIYAFCRSLGQVKVLWAAFEGQWEGTELVNFKAREPVVEFASRLEGVWEGQSLALEYGFSAAFQPGDKKSCKVQSEWYSSGQPEKTSPKIGLAKTRITRYDGSLGINLVGDKDVKEKHALKAVTAVLSPAHFYRFDARLMATPASIDEGRKFRMDPDGFGLSTLLDDILGFDAEKFLQLSQEFCKYFPEFRRVRVQTEMAWNRAYAQSGLHKSGQATGKGIYFETQDGGTVRAQQASDGALLFLGFLSLLYIPTPPKVLLIEEPEKGVYPKRLEEIVGLLRRVINPADGRDVPQIILSTHSPFVLSLFRPDEVTLMSRRGDHVIARPLRDAPNIEERLDGGEFYLGELWYNLDEEELFQDARIEHHS